MKNVSADLYADDTTLYDIQTSLEMIEQNLQTGLKISFMSGVEIMAWFLIHLKQK